MNKMELSPVKKAEPLKVRATDHPDQFWIEGMSEGRDYDERYVSISGFYGNYGPDVFAAAPDLLEALTLAAQSAGFQYMIAETRAKIEAAIAKAEGMS